MMNNQSQFSYTVVSNTTANQLTKKQKQFANKIKAMSMPSTKLIDYKYRDLFSILKPFSQIAAEYQWEVNQKKYARQQAQRRLRYREFNRGFDPEL